ncbi:MAG TPA: hypothetical protein VKG78_10035 [Opitutaceae bacterium]|nr:hypothetical protein [Opitutaceae bacterium]
MARFRAFLALLVIALPIAGVFGAFHDQISYTVSEEYFTKFKFHQFGFLNPAVPERIRAAAVGFLASWWMGIPIGLLVAPVSFICGSSRDMLTFGIRSYWVLVAFAGLFALGGLLFGYGATAHIELSQYAYWYIPPNVAHLRRFLCAGYMHNSAYLGGIVGVLASWAYLVGVHIRRKPNQPPDPTSAPATPTDGSGGAPAESADH